MKKNPSRAAVRILTILAFIESAVIEAGKQSDPLIKSRVDYTRHHCSFTTNQWELTGSENRAVEGAFKALAKINVGLNEIWWLKAKPDMNLPGMLYIAMQLLDDLMNLITNNTKKIWLQDIFDALKGLIDYVDPEGTMFLTQDRAQEVVNVIYNVVGER